MLVFFAIYDKVMMGLQQYNTNNNLEMVYSQLYFYILYNTIDNLDCQFRIYR